MADSEVGGLAPATTPHAAADKLHVVQEGNSRQTTVGKIRERLFQEKSADYTVVYDNMASLLRVTSAATLSLTSAATLGANWWATIKADGGNVVIDPNGSELVNGAGTYTVYDGGEATIVCDGTGFRVVADSSRYQIPAANLLQNPLFQIDIEGNAGGKTANGSYIVEGWRLVHNSDVSTITGSRDGGSAGAPHSLKLVVTTGSDASIAAGQYALYDTAIEGSDFAVARWGTGAAKPIWVGGLVTSPTTGVYCVALQNAGATRSYVFEVACTAGTPTEFLVRVPGDTSGSWAITDGTVGLRLACVAAAGSTYQTTADTWSAGNYLCTSSQENGLASNANVFKIEDLRVSVGRPIRTEWTPVPVMLKRCQRYFESSYDPGTAPGTATYVGAVFMFTQGGNRQRVTISYKATKAKTPTPTVYSPYNGTSGQGYDATGSVGVVLGTVGNGRNSCTFEGSSGITDSNRLQVQWASNARLL